MGVVRHITGPSRVPSSKNSPRRPDRPEDWLTVSEAILLAVRGSATHRAAAYNAGISPATLSVWIKRGLEHLDEMAVHGLEDPEPGEAPYVHLALEIAAVDAQAEVSIVGDVRAHARRDGRVGLLLLSRRYGGVWQEDRKLGVELSGPGGAELGVLVPSHEEMAQLRAEADQRVRELAPVDVREAAG